MITFRNEIFDSLMHFLKELKNYKPFETMLDGKFKGRIENIYNEALKKMRISDTNSKLIGDTFRYLNERIPSEDIDAMNECELMGKECVSSAIGQEIFEEAKANLIKRKQIEELDKQMMEADIKLRKAEEEHFKFVDAQDKTVKEYEDAKIAMDKLRKMKEEIAIVKAEEIENIETTPVDTAEEKVNE